MRFYFYMLSNMPCCKYPLGMNKRAGPKAGPDIATDWITILFA